MALAGGLLMHAASFWAFVFLVPTAGVAATAWVVAYAGGVAYLLAAPHLHGARLSPVQSLKLLGYCVLVAALFFGADSALNALGNSVKTRQALPAAFGGLEVWFLLVPGVAAPALGSWVTGVLRGQHPFKRQLSQGDPP